MTGERSPASRLDALLTGMEEDILGLDDQSVVREGEESFSDASRVRSLIRSAIDSHTHAQGDTVTPRRHTTVTTTIVRNGQPKQSRGTHTYASLGRDVTRGAGRLRMAYSGSSDERKEDPPPKKTSRKRLANAASSNKKT